MLASCAVLSVLICRRVKPLICSVSNAESWVDLSDRIWIVPNAAICSDFNDDTCTDVKFETPTEVKDEICEVVRAAIWGLVSEGISWAFRCEI